MPFIRLTKLSFNYRTTTSNLYARYLFSSTRVVTPVARPLHKFSAILEGERLTFNRLEEIRLRTIETLSDAE
ncbi:hypothetical protein L249_6922 [Ophiocordyceps polyrhachis-furcata BCC 54312]|uniref:Uncharacterized protein n=1 Tax=Ophiocordyceps polyrhachis-furcata BCC 54312 TaxID=1330021 RepID=A0A367LLE4_9HYPO|nr:hypothetical protein L249_6922 [Ophiocordyceps polyrhachis-furcata BCC 54312]